jgi:hypothetical protein
VPFRGFPEWRRDDGAITSLEDSSYRLPTVSNRSIVSGVHSGPTASDLGREEFMDFIERLFGISPDAGSGATEAMIVLVPLSIVAFLAYRRIRQDSTRPPATGPR